MIHTFVNCTVLAFRHPLVGAPGVGFHGGPVILDARWDLLRHTRYHRPVDYFRDAQNVSRRLEGDFIYLGPAYGHFGHVMSEMVHRMAQSKYIYNKNMKYLVVSTLEDKNFSKPGDLPQFYREALAMFEIDEKLVTIINRDHVVDRLTCVRQGSDFGGGPIPEYLAILSRFSSNDIYKQKHKWVYVSRSKIPGGGGFLGEKFIEEALKENGFMIFHPEDVSLRQQMDVYRSADLIVFPEGSACHGVELLGEMSLRTVLFIGRRLSHFEIFSKVLSSRSHNFIAIKPRDEASTIFQTLVHITVAVFPVVAVLKELSDLGCFQYSSLKIKQEPFLDLCVSDLNDHLNYHLSNNSEDISVQNIIEIHNRVKYILEENRSEYIHEDLAI